MTTGTRIYELARELGMENKSLLDLCGQLGIVGKKSHSNSLTDDEADRIRRSVIRRAVDEVSDSEREVKRGDDVVTERRVGTVIRRRKKEIDEAEAEAAAAAAEQERAIDLSGQEKRSTAPVEEFDRRTALAQADALFRAPEILAKEEPAAVTPPPSEPEPEVTPDVDTSEQANISVPVAAAGTPGARGAKVLGRIELPQKPVVEPKRPRAGAAGVETSPADAEAELESKSKQKRRKAVDTFQSEELDFGKRPKKRQVLQKFDLLDYSEERDSWRGKKGKRGKERREDGTQQQEVSVVGSTKRPLKLGAEVSVGDLSKSMGVKVGEVMTLLMKLGLKLNINQPVDFDTATVLASEFGFTTQNVGDEAGLDELLATFTTPENAEDLVIRPPVVTVMGHVDHGKTSLLDAIRKTSVVKGEAGGITQHIGAYSVKVPSGGFVTFLDTPGHEAFTAMRGRGAKVTDIVVLVVAADDGIMPQTVEAINHAQAAKVPLIVAINKMDKEGANPERIKSQMAEHGLVPEEWGGDTIVVPVSAHTGAGLDLLLENLHLQSEILELKANPEGHVRGTVIESRLDRGRGPVMTVLVQNGTLEKGDIFVCGAEFGKVRAMLDDQNNQVESAGPSMAVEVLGASAPPMSGDDFLVVDTETQARQIMEHRARLKRSAELAHRREASLTLEKFSEMIETGEIKELPLIVKGDVQGSVEALCGALGSLANDEVKVRILHSGVGAVTENDVQLASASRALLAAFHVRADVRAAALAEQEGIEIIYSRVIYELVDRVKQALDGMLKPIIREKTLGRVEVRQTFKVPKSGVIAGSYVVDGVVSRGANVRLLRDNRVLYEGKMGSLRRFKDDVREVAAGYECGIGIEGYADIQEGDVIEVYKFEEIARSGQAAEH